MITFGIEDQPSTAHVYTFTRCIVIVPAGSMVVFAVGAGPPHVGVWRDELPNVLNARSLSAATGRAGCSKPRPGRDDLIPSRGTW